MRFVQTNGQWNVPSVVVQMPYRGENTIPTIIAEEAYKEYSAKYGSQQSLDRLVERGGFGTCELAILLYERIKRIEFMLKSETDAAYEERNRCVAVIAKMALDSGFVAGVAKTRIAGWSEDWHGCVYIELPIGQVSWHFHDSQANLFAFLPEYTKPYNGHTSEDKYKKMEEFCNEFSKE